MLVVEESPVDCHEEVEERYASIEGQLWDLCSGKLAVGIPKLDDGLVVARSELVREDAVIARVFDIVFDRLGVLQVDRFADDKVLGLFGGIRRQDELSNVLLFTESGLDILLLADPSFLWA